MKEENQKNLIAFLNTLITFIVDDGIIVCVFALLTGVGVAYSIQVLIWIGVAGLLLSATVAIILCCAFADIIAASCEKVKRDNY